ncbi:MAG: hypothetical protein AB7V62_11550 [Thermoleophilia bacterium]
MALTWPLLLNMGSEVVGGGSGGDRAGYVYDVWFNEHFGLQLWGIDREPALMAPFGREAPGSLNLLQIVFLGPAWLVATVAGPVAGVNASLLLGMTLGPAAMYLLVRWLGLGVVPATWALVAFAIFPNALLRATGHYPLALLACFPILFIAVWRWLERPGLRRSLWMAAAVLFCWLTNPYWGIAAFVAILAAGIVALVLGVRATGWVPALKRIGEAAGAVVVIVLLPLAAMFAASSDVVESGITRPRLDLALYGAQITDYLIPDQGQYFFTDVFGSDWATMGSAGGERSAFLGYGTMLLSLLGLALAYRYRRELSSRLRVMVLSAVPMILLIGWFSLATPTKWFGVTIPTPSDALFEALPFLRAYARFAAPVMALVIVLAALGIHLALRGRRPAVGLAVLVPLVAIAFLELPPGGGLPLTSGAPITVAGVPAEDLPLWTWVRDETPDDAIVHAFPSYPNELVERYSMYGQRVHGRAITNGDAQQIQVGSDFTTSVADPRLPGAARDLATVGADYVTVIPELYGIVGVNPPDVNNPPDGFAVEQVFPDGTAAWRVTAEPRDGLAFVAVKDFWAPQGRDGLSWRFMRDDAVVHLYAPQAGDYTVDFRIRSADDSPRPLVIEADGDEVLDATVGPEQAVSLDLTLPEGRTDLRLVNPGYSAQDIPSGDPRAWSFEVSDMTLTRQP